MDDTVKVDGAVVRGGGQVLRNAASYAAILGKSVQFVNIRASRRRPGLRPQYIEGLQVVARLSKCTLVNAYEGSQEVSFIPGELGAVHQNVPSIANTAPSYEVHTKDAATSLLLQAVLPVLLFSPNVTNLVLSGGVDMLISPSIDYMKLVLVLLLHRHFKVTVNVDIKQRDCMPSGKALINIITYPTESLPPIHMRDRGSVVRIRSILYGYGKVDHQQFVDAAKMALHEALRENGITDMDVIISFASDMQEFDSTDHPLVCRALVYAETSTGCILGGGSTVPKERGESTLTEPKELMSSAVMDLVKQLAHGGCVDEYLQDQLIIFMALADGVSEIITGPITEHTKSALEIAEIMTDAKFFLTPVLAGSTSNRVEIKCEGIGHQSRARRPTAFLTCSQHQRPQDFNDTFQHVNAT